MGFEKEYRISRSVYQKVYYRFFKPVDSELTFEEIQDKFGSYKAYKTALESGKINERGEWMNPYLLDRSEELGFEDVGALSNVGTQDIAEQTSFKEDVIESVAKALELGYNLSRVDAERGHPPAPHFGVEE